MENIKYYYPALVAPALNFGVTTEDTGSAPVMFVADEPIKELLNNFSSAKKPTRTIVSITCVYNNKLYELPIYVKTIPNELGLFMYPLSHIFIPGNEVDKSNPNFTNLQYLPLIDIFSWKKITKEKDIYSCRNDMIELVDAINLEVAVKGIKCDAFDIPMYIYYKKELVIVVQSNGLFWVCCPNVVLTTEETDAIASEIFKKLYKQTARLELMNDGVYDSFYKSLGLTSESTPADIVAAVKEHGIIPSFRGVDFDKLKKEKNKLKSKKIAI